MLIKKIFLFFTISMLFYSFAKSQEIMIITKVDNEIITNIDILQEANYLISLNNDTQVLNLKFSHQTFPPIFCQVGKKNFFPVGQKNALG